MQSVSAVRRNLLLINAVLTALLLWLITSFWYDAYVQRKDAVLLQQNVRTGELLQEVARALAAERRLYSATLSATNAAQNSVVEEIQSLQQKSDSQLDFLIQQAHKDHTNRSLVARYNHTLFSLQKWSAEIDKTRRRLNVYRQYTRTQLVLAATHRDTDIGHTLFDGFSNLIALVENLKASTSFIPRHNEMNTIGLQNLQSSIWQLSEASNQEIALLTELTSADVQPDDQLTVRLQLLREKVSRYRNVLMLYSEEEGVSAAIASEIKSIQRIYTREYFEARSRVLFKTNGFDDLGFSHYSWDRVTAELSFAIDSLSAAVSLELKQIAGNARAQGTRRLIIDSAVVLVCLLIAIASLGLIKKIRHIAYHDSLTNLPNRHQFETILGASIDVAKHSAGNCAVLLLDLDRFKTINDTFGHGMGDKLLIEIAERLQTHCQHRAIPARMGGDEFAILIRDVESLEQPMKLAQRLVSSVEEDIRINGAKLKVGLSVGISVSPEDGESTTALLKSADIAMYHAKTEGNEKIYRYDGSMAVLYQHRIQTEIDLQIALSDSQFELHYQPQVKVSSGRVDCVEALLRWHHPTRGMVSPGEFIPIAEAAGMLVRLGAWVLDEACRQLVAWHKTGLGELRVAVNISPQQFAQDDFYDVVLGTLERHGLDRRFLELEVTESIVMKDVDRVADVLQRLRRANIKIAVDDFGTGYSSLQYLQDLPLDILKIDKAFVDGLGKGDPFKSVANSIVQLSRSFDLETIAEGVETAEQLAQLEALGVQYIQGYYYSKPVASGDVHRVIEQIENSATNRRDAA